MSDFAYHEGRIIIDFGLSEHGEMEIQTTVGCPETDDEDALPHRMMVEGAIMMARDSLDELYAGE